LRSSERNKALIRSISLKVSNSCISAILTQAGRLERPVRL
jgi:hypothetical protein